MDMRGCLVILVLFEKAGALSTCAAVCTCLPCARPNSIMECHIKLSSIFPIVRKRWRILATVIRTCFVLFTPVGDALRVFAIGVCICHKYNW